MALSVPLALLLGLGGLFWLTVVFALVGMALVMTVPRTTPVVVEPQDATGVSMGPVWLLSLSVFLLHGIMTLLFVTLPPMLVADFGLELSVHWKLYVPTMLVSVVIMLPILRKVGSSLSEQRLLPWAFMGLALAVGLAGGWMASRALDGGAEATAAVVPASQDTWLLHVASSDPARMQVALNRAEELMNGPGATAHSRVEIVANEGGLDLLRSDRTPFADRIRELAEQDVLFFACNRAIERLQERGVEVHLVPEANTHYSALDRVVHRMQQGWTYEKI